MATLNITGTQVEIEEVSTFLKNRDIRHSQPDYTSIRTFDTTSNLHKLASQIKELDLSSIETEIPIVFYG